MRFKKLKTMAVTAALVVFGCFQAFAAKNSYQITSLTVGFTESKEEPGIIREAEPTVKGSYCEITEWSCSHEYDDWRPGNKVTFSITINPTNDRFFAKNTTKVKVSGKNTELASSSITKSKITLKVNYWPSMTFENPENLIWEDEDGEDWVAVWDKVEKCSAYEVKIQMTDDDGKKKNKTVTVTKPKIDLSDYATEGEVTFSVRAVPKNDSQKKYYTASEWVAMNDVATPSYDNTVYGSFKGDTGNRTFVTNNGKTASGWQTINDTYYYFDPENKNRMVESKWMYLNDKWYYFDADGSMITGWAKIDNYWYYFNTSMSNDLYGSMKTGWISNGPSGPWYYLNDGSITDIPVGANLRDAITPDGYKVDKNGACYETGNTSTVKNEPGNISGWKLVNNTWYYYDETSHVKVSNSWKYINQKWYYFGADGAMDYGWQYINGYWYYLKEDFSAADFGSMLKGWVYAQTSGSWYYLNDGSAAGYPEGACLMNTITPDGYRVDENGVWR